jgi:hypothetical protein
MDSVSIIKTIQIGLSGIIKIKFDVNQLRESFKMLNFKALELFSLPKEVYFKTAVYYCKRELLFPAVMRKVLRSEASNF